MNSSSKNGGRYSAVPSPTAAGFNTNAQYGSQTNGSSGYDGTGSVEDLTMGLRGMSVGEDYNNQGSSYRPATATNMPQAQTAPPARAPHMLKPHQSRPSFGGYGNPGDYQSYYSAPSNVDFYSYGSNSDASIYGSPAPTNATAAPGGVYAGMPTPAVHTVHPDMRQPGLFYDFSGSARPPTSQFYYSTQPLMHYAAPHSPMQSTTISQMAPASLSDKKRELQVRSLTNKSN